ncbi:unnamed protein product [Phytophthora lilii]|uniref:Probable pectate lyase F n=1 Tax=Phytophthora lilii TaxID=2077276 RepID=A0A9W6WU55_9STRA|nr:unnamed protein product [Phytophthora lilii]
MSSVVVIIKTTVEPDAKDLYRELLALRKRKAKATQDSDQNNSDARSDEVGATRPAQPSSPKKVTVNARRTISVVNTRLESAPSSPERCGNSNNDKINDGKLVASTQKTIVLMQAALLNREKELQRSEKAVDLADAELREELVRAEKILPSKFLFERNLVSDRALEAARNVLNRFQHRIFKLYFRHWWTVTMELRLQAQRQAVAEIIRVYRGHRGRREARRLQREIKALQAQRRQLLEFRIKYRSSQAMKIQMAWRRFLQRRAINHRQARQAAASLLQQAFRTRQWRSQSLVTALANARKLFAAVGMQKLFRGHRTRRKLAEYQRRQRQEERVQLALLQNMSKEARAVWMIERRGAGYLIAHKAIFPYAMRMRWHRLCDQLRRQGAAKCIARVVCNWFGVEARREAIRVKEISEWLALVQREHRRSRAAAILIQKHLRRWVQQRKFLMAEARRKKFARRDRLAEKSCRMEQRQQHKGSGWAGTDSRRSLTVSTSPVERKASRFSSKAGLGPQPPRLMSFLKPIQLKETNPRTLQRHNVEAAVILQRCYRNYSARKRAQVDIWRKKAQKVEARVMVRRKAATEIQRHARGILKLCRQHMADGFVAQSFAASFEGALRPLLSGLTAPSRSPSKTKASPTKQSVAAALSGKHQSLTVAFPVLQMAFLVASGWKMPFVWRDLDSRIIFQTKFERAKAVAFFRSLDKQGKPVAHQLQRAPAAEVEPASLSPTRRNNKIATKGAKGVAGLETFSSVDVDVAVARATGGAKGALDFAAFVRVLGQLGEISLAQHFQDSSPYWGRYDGAEARVMALLWFSLLPHPTMQPLALQFEAFVSQELSQRATCIQKLFTWQHNKRRGAAMLVEIRRNLQNESLSRAAVVLQAQVRTLLARRELRRRIQATYEKFLDPTWGLPYWMNPHSGFSTWQKPSRLGAEDVRGEPVPFPPPERTLKAPCNGRKGCERCAEWVCYGCDEFFCRECFGEYHKSKPISQSIENSMEDSFGPMDNDKNAKKDADNGDKQTCVKREHELERLLLCGLCKFQLASRRCIDCIPKVESKLKTKLPLLTKPSSAKAGKHSTNKPVGKADISTSNKIDDNEQEENSNSESLFCDVCFGFLHRRGGLRTHRIEPLLDLCTSCIPDDEDNNSSTSHTVSTSFTIPGAGDAVQWECKVCGDSPRRICGRCALQSHSKESCGELRPVPLQTLGRRQRTKRLQEEQEARDRADLEKMRARGLRARQERCARKIQAFWSSQIPIVRAKRLVAARRKEKSELWLRRQEDAQLAKRLAYRAKNALGMAPPLRTDSVVDRRLRSLHALARRQLFIRARFFGLLIDEYVTVGIPLPGLGLLHPGSNEVWTSEDLRGWVRNRQTIRFKKLTPEESRPSERSLCAWRQLEHWGKIEDNLPVPENQEADSGAQSQPQPLEMPWLADVHPKQAITESMVPLALPYNPPLPKMKSRKNASEDEEDVVEDEPVAMFLVEFSLDPKRTVWINHSLAERFWEWKRLKLLARSERAAQRNRAKEYEKQQKEDEQMQDEELKRQEYAAVANDIQETPVLGDKTTVVDPAPDMAVADQVWPAPNSTWTTNEEVTDPYYNYNYNYYPTSESQEPWSGYDGYSTNYPASYPAGYDYGYGASALEPAPVIAEGATGLVDSGSYYANGEYAGNGSGDSNWYGTEYSAYDMSGFSPAPTDYNYNTSGSNSSGWADYAGNGSATGSGNYAESQRYGAPNAAWYSSGGDAAYAYPAAEQPAVSDSVSGSTYSIELPSAGSYALSSSAAAAPWEEVFDPASQQSYFVNRVTLETAWQPPA